ncbi:hypothetical protein CANCADRAFT_25262 [Tortispora caseinolytica NRRL Y-17796]|uniref:t-SNARE coiled-coil homology domain-containing protein n=1 Tax=Tortispora caseinolytica NRRL Y-17796 TaxID=767744 RepID=A0A1E4TDM7_9ASCO|nr:hypothetical protein CANCADRAFT_25262 [Tortispora caseinolytica NRRL Y-17796]
MRFVKQASVASSRNALRYAQEAEDSGRNTLGMLGSQSERITNTDATLGLASAQTRIAEEKAKELKKLNRSIFAIHASNPFNSKRKILEKEEKLKEQIAEDQANRERFRNAMHDTQSRIGSAMRADSKFKPADRQAKLADRARYQFEGDSEDEELEDEINDNLDAIGQSASRLKSMALAAQEEVDRQNQHLDKIAEDTDNLDINVHLNTSRLARIK